MLSARGNNLLNSKDDCSVSGLSPSRENAMVPSLPWRISILVYPHERLGFSSSSYPCRTRQPLVAVAGLWPPTESIGLVRKAGVSDGAFSQGHTSDASPTFSAFSHHLRHASSSVLVLATIIYGAPGIQRRR
jgi:hypothetical protein